jgi:histone acetyltransferase (RNA polymerase elongator complex component)
MKKHANLSIFVPHAGCPAHCSFCDQRAITAQQAPPTPEEVTALCERFLPKAADAAAQTQTAAQTQAIAHADAAAHTQAAANTEIAFFGGSFTAIDAAYRRALLCAAQPFIKAGRCKGIRISTRPDAIDAQILQELSCFGVTAIELGAQSMDDTVLRKNARDGAVNTLMQLLQLAPDTMRIYPAVTLRGTALARLYQEGAYTPLTLQEAVSISAQLLLLCEGANVRVIRVGLAADEGLCARVVAGPYHPAFRQLCEAEIYYAAIAKKLYAEAAGRYNITVALGMRSNAAGQKNANIRRFQENGYQISITESPALTGRAFTWQKQ